MSRNEACSQRPNRSLDPHFEDLERIQVWTVCEASDEAQHPPEPFGGLAYVAVGDRFD
jgi:hypothetical protein